MAYIKRADYMARLSGEKKTPSITLDVNGR